MPESIGSIFQTQIPSLSENANIQDALKIFHYGTKTIPSTISQLNPNSIAGHLQTASSRLEALEELGIGSSYGSSEPEEKVDGSIWVKSDSNAPIYQNFFVAFYQEEEPETEENGVLWVNSVTKDLKIYDESDLTWKTVSSSGGSSVGAVSINDLTGQGISITGLDAITANGLGLQPIFGYQPGGVPTPFSVSITTTKDNAKIDIEYIFGKATPAAAGKLELLRLINAGLPVSVASFYFNGTSSPQIKYVDSLATPEGSVVTYVLQNSSSETIVFDGTSDDYTIEVVAKEIG